MNMSGEGRAEGRGEWEEAGVHFLEMGEITLARCGPQSLVNSLHDCGAISSWEILSPAPLTGR